MCEVSGCLTGCSEASELVHAAVRAPEFEVRFLKLLIPLLQLDCRVAHALAKYAFFSFEFCRQLQLSKQEIGADEYQCDCDQKHPDDVLQITKRHRADTVEALHDLNRAAWVTILSNCMEDAI